MTRSGIGATLLLVVRFGVTPLAAQQSEAGPPRSFGVAYIGAGLSEFQFIAGGQAWLRFPLPMLSLVPEVAIGHGTSVLAGGGVHLATTSESGRLYAGLGYYYLWWESGSAELKEFVFTPKAGLMVETAALRGLLGSSSAGWMLEYQGVDWFQWHRILIGARWNF